MPHYTIANLPFRDSSCHVYDANGLEYVRVLEMDTDTGRIVYQAGDGDGDGTVWLDPETGAVLRETVWAAPPLLLKKCQRDLQGRCPDERPGHRALVARYKDCICVDGLWAVVGSPPCPAQSLHARDGAVARERYAERQRRQEDPNRQEALKQPLDQVPARPAVDVVDRGNH